MLEIWLGAMAEALEKLAAVRGRVLVSHTGVFYMCRVTVMNCTGSQVVQRIDSQQFVPYWIEIGVAYIARRRSN